MNQSDLQSLLTDLIKTWENEVIEFKAASNDFNTDKIGQYFSALGNEANIRNLEHAWLVFGVDDKTHKIIGTDYRPERSRLQGLKHQINQVTSPSLTFREIHELMHGEGRVVLFEIPAAPRGMPVAWKGQYYARAGESLVPLGLDKLDEIRNQMPGEDWSAVIVPEATPADLDDQAVDTARRFFALKYSNRFTPAEIHDWPMEVFLERARLTRDRRITRATLLLLGKPESAQLLSPHPAQMTWKLVGPEKAYSHFGTPFLLNTTELYRKIRNIQIRMLPDGTLLPIEIAKYDQKIVLEALHNCIAHQDYTRNARIVVTEEPDRLIFENDGAFFDGQPEDYIDGHKTPRRYRNTFLVNAMAELNMIDTMGYGIHAMFVGQKNRFFPMPDYDLSESQAVRMTIYGSILDPAYSRLLIEKTDLPLQDILALDRIQKHLPINDTASTRLRRAGLIEGRKPNLHISAFIANAVDKRADYIRMRSQDDEFLAKLVTDFIKTFGSASRADIDRLLTQKMGDLLTDQQKSKKISNLLFKASKLGTIQNVASRRSPRWVLQNRTTKSNKSDNEK
ncbi:MAG TPA: putative DNA binding domain-containing protein [Myxococcota bacterium]|nr:putative DNA binding domain-containing protein [Myxococcota bacterium]HOA13045.1 putative DNA binding domain-containing protein [Myxococcota bacterium]HOD00230.1 putative DNA binding domain-containing protein [Myxococcota bacterium]HOH76097.1 putative DNA binding domain-containing protein [Myxococcota bacterium]HPV04324.1 putative DNA binding domain-containing protein [Myxococcota bacterium]